MNDPENLPIDNQEMFDWIKRYKQERGLSWSVLARESGIPSGTLSNLGSGSYGGNYDEQAKRIYRFKQKVESQEARSRTAIAAPVFIETPTARRVQFLLEVAHMGRITVGAMGPGTGKTMTAEHYAASMAPVWMATMRQSKRGVAAMIDQVMRSMGLDARSGWTRQRSDEVVNFVQGRKGLLIVDEANHLDWDALEELRGWHDATGLGIALLGNEELHMRIKGGAKRHAYARLNSRIAQSHIQDMPTDVDVRVFLDALGIDDTGMLRLLTKVAVTPGSGGLREVQQILESANMLAIADDTVLELGHIEQSLKTRATSQMRRVA